MGILVKKIKLKMLEALRYFLIKVSLLMNNSKLTAFILYRSSKYLKKSGKPLVLCLHRSIFIEDVIAMAKFSNQLDYTSIHREYFRFILRHFLTKEEVQKVYEYNYYVALINSVGRQKYYDYLLKLLVELQNYLGFKAILVGNIGYIEHQEISKVCKKLDISFVVLHKEAIVVSESYHVFLNLYKDLEFYGTKIMFYNQQCL